MDCGKKIELEKTGTAVAYCVLKQAHKGKCQAVDWITRAYQPEPKKERL